MTGLQTHSKSKFQRRDYIHAIATSVPTHRVVTVWQGESEPDVEPVVAIEHQVKTTFATHDKLQGTPATPEEFKANGWHVSFHGTEQYPVINRDNELCTVLPDEMSGPGFQCAVVVCTWPESEDAEQFAKYPQKFARWFEKTGGES